MKNRISKLQNMVLDSSFIKQITHLLKNLKVSRYKVSLFEVLRIFFNQIKKDDLQTKANAMAYNFILSVFPGIIFIFTLIPYIPIAHLDVEIMEFLSNTMPKSLFDQASETILDIVSKQRGGLLSLGFLLSLYAAMNGSLAMMGAFNNCYKTVDKRGFLKTRLIALAITFMLIFVLLIAIVIITIGELVLGYLEKNTQIFDNYIWYLLLILRYLMVIIAFFFSISFIYYYAPALHKRFGFLSFGSVVATILIILVSLGFSVYLNNFATYNKVYGSIGTLIALMLWFYLISYILLIGFELNACVDTVRILEERKLKMAQNNYENG